MPSDPLTDPLLRSPRSFVPTIPAMTEAAAAATPEQLADFVDAIGAAGGGGGGGGGGGNATNLDVVASPTGVTVTSDSGTDAAIPLANGTNAGLMAPAQVLRLENLSNVDNTSDTAKPVSVAQQLAINAKLNKATKGSVGATAVVVVLADAGLNNMPHTLTVTPDTGCTIVAEASYNDGTTWVPVGTATSATQWDYDLGPADPGWVTRVRLTRTAGTSTASTFSIRG